MLVEIFLQLLICIVNVELLEAVDLWGKKEADIRDGEHKQILMSWKPGGPEVHLLIH